MNAKDIPGEKIVSEIFGGAMISTVKVGEYTFSAVLNGLIRDNKNGVLKWAALRNAMNFWRFLNTKVEEIFQTLESDIVANGTLVKRAGKARKCRRGPVKSRANKKDYRKNAGDTPNLRKGAIDYAPISEKDEEKANTEWKRDNDNDRLWKFHNMIVELTENVSAMNEKERNDAIVKINRAFHRLSKEQQMIIEPICRKRATGWRMLPVNKIFAEEES